MAMIKERFIEQYGKPKFTFGLGSSGGAMQQHLIAHNYPGLLDALTPVRLYPDTDSMTLVTDVLDCGPLNNYFDNPANAPDWPAAEGPRSTATPSIRKGAPTATAGAPSRATGRSRPTASTRSCPWPRATTR